MQSPKRIAVVGTGVAGLTAAYLLSRKHEVHLYEAGDYAGGHTNTRTVSLAGRDWPVNTGFIVFNDWTYPNFIRLMKELEVAWEESEMSFSVQSGVSGLEYNGTSLNTLFAQRSNLVNPKFLQMVREILRFNELTCRELRSDAIPPNETVGAYLDRHRFSRYFRNHYIIPMGAAIWSAPEAMIYQFPVLFFLRFFENHGMLSVDDRPNGGYSRAARHRMWTGCVRPLATGFISTPLCTESNATRPALHFTPPGAKSTLTKW